MYYFLISHMFYYSRSYVSLLLLVLFSIGTIYLLQSCALHVITLDNCPMSRSYALHHFSRQKIFPWGVSVGRGSQVVGRGFQVVGRGSWVIDWKGSALAQRRFFGIPSISKQTLSSLQQQIIHVF